MSTSTWAEFRAKYEHSDPERFRARHEARLESLRRYHKKLRADYRRYAIMRLRWFHRSCRKWPLEVLKRRCRVLTAYLKRGGLLVPPDKCPGCGRKVTLHAHHTNYCEPLEVVWGCRLCHNKEHRRLGSKRRSGYKLRHKRAAYRHVLHPKAMELWLAGEHSQVQISKILNCCNATVCRWVEGVARGQGISAEQSRSYELPAAGNTNMESAVQKIDPAVILDYGCELWVKRQVRFNHSQLDVRAWALLAEGPDRKLCFNSYNETLGSRRGDPVQMLGLREFKDGNMASHRVFACPEGLEAERRKLARAGYQRVETGDVVVPSSWYASAQWRADSND